MKNKLVDGFNHVFGRHGFDYSRISENIFLGTNMCCQFGFAKKLLELEKGALRIFANQSIQAS